MVHDEVGRDVEHPLGLGRRFEELHELHHDCVESLIGGVVSRADEGDAVAAAAAPDPCRRSS